MESTINERLTFISLYNGTDLDTFREDIRELRENKVSDYVIADNMLSAMSKGEIMRLLFDTDYLRNIDSATPIETWKSNDPSYHVMDFNESPAFGRLVNLIELFITKILKDV